MSELEKVAAKRMRMLRLNAGWSAEQLSQQYEAAGVGSLPRTTIAKIESGRREIKAGEVEGVARVFGLTVDDLLDRDGPRVTLSYAREDRGAGQEVVAWLGDHGFQAIAAGQPAAGNPGPGSGDAPGIDTAQAFVVLLSPNFLASSRCRDELALAMRREQQLVSAGHDAAFIHILRVAATPDIGRFGLKAYRQVDLTQDSEKARDAALSKLGGSILSGPRTTAAPAGPQVHAPAKQKFLDRAEELERLLNTLSSSAGPHFWLVISPPGLGKSSFLGQLERAAEAGESSATRWVPKAIDLRHDDLGHKRKAPTVVRELFELEEPPSATPDQPPPVADDELIEAVQRITHTGRPWLCLMDSAELLPAGEITQLRRYLGKIHQLIQNQPNTGARLAFVVASQRDDRWRGVTPYPGLSALPLEGFGAAAVQNALEELARDMPHVVRSPKELRADALLVQRVTEGVPELVLESLRWIRRQDWIEIGRLDRRPELFDEISSGYIQEKLLGQGSLFPGGESQSSGSAEQLKALQEALRTLAPYRLFTRYHVQEQRDSDPSFRAAMKDADWELDDLWQAIAGTALLQKPLDEPWQELHPVVRRLLYRHFYPPEDRAEAHHRARDFSKKWANELTGKEQIVGMVEAIWHETARLRTEGAVTMGEGNLTSFARKLSLEINRKLPGEIKESPYSAAELREYAAERIRNDDELQREAAGSEDIFEKLIEVIVNPKSA